MKTLIICIVFIQLIFADKQDDPAFKSYYKAYEFVLGEEWDKAINQFQEVIKNYLKSDYIDESYFWIAYSTKEKGDLEKAVNLYNSFIKDYSSSNMIDQAMTNRTSIAKLLVRDGKKDYSKYIESYQETSSRRDRAEQRRDREDSVADRDEREEDYDDVESDSEKDELIEASVQALANQGGADSAAKLKEIILSGKHSRRVREKAIFWYGQSRSGNLDDLVSIFNQLKDNRLKEKCIFSISQHSGSKAGEILMNIALDDKQSINTREKAIFWIGNSSSRSNSANFEKLLKEVKDTRLREKLMFAISQSSLPNRGKMLRDIALNSKESDRVREKAIFWLGNNSRNIEDLKMLYASISDERLQEKLIFAFHQSGSDEAIDYMIKLLNMDATSTQVKKKIIFWLGQSKSEKARKAISSLLD
ncbi:MAG: tetratricopeptide repeat protein [Calditrichaeota bacterium]|nr:tetratricopeptide repeat protein [Calditrichota bacterium]